MWGQDRQTGGGRGGACVCAPDVIEPTQGRQACRAGLLLAPSRVLTQRTQPSRGVTWAGDMQLAVGCGAQSVRMALSLAGGVLPPEQAEPRMAILVHGVVHTGALGSRSFGDGFRWVEKVALVASRGAAAPDAEVFA